MRLVLEPVKFTGTGILPQGTTNVKKHADRFRRLGLLILIAGASSALSGLCGSPQSASKTYFRQTDSAFHLGNQLVELQVDRKTGFFRDIYGKTAGLHHQPSANRGSWPYSLRLGTPRAPDLLRVEIKEDALHPQTVQAATVPDAGGQTLELVYENLLTTGGAPSGVNLTVRIRLKEDADYFLISATVRNRSKYEVTNLVSGGGLVAGVNREEETLAVPGWDYGKLWANPVAQFPVRETFGYPIFGSNAGLDAGWMDLYGPKGGVGIGYLNCQGLSMLFNVEAKRGGLEFNWQLFNVNHEKATERWTSVGGIYGLEPGRDFTTDQWILAPHAGDWHRMADIYRIEYEKAFKDDYLTWKETSQVAKDLDLITSYTILNARNRAPFYGDQHKFLEVPPLVSQLLKDIGVLPRNLLVGFLGHSPHWPLQMPDFYPCCEEGGGTEACRQMIGEIKGLGVEAIQFYAHLFYNHPKANDYVAEADTGYDHQNALWLEIGNVANTDSVAWQKLWKNKYIPGYRDLGVTGVFLDQGPTQYVVPPTAGADNLRILGAHVRGVREMLRAFRDGFAGQPFYFWTEVGSDLQTRDVDIWTTGGGYAQGGQLTTEMVRYTFPYRLAVDHGVTVEAINQALVNGFILSLPSEIPEAAKPAVRQFASMRRLLRERAAPGFPEGFRDRVGLRFDSSKIRARSYSSSEGITVLYAALADTDASIEVDRGALGRGTGIERVSVKLRAGETGYQILK